MSEGRRGALRSIRGTEQTGRAEGVSVTETQGSDANGEEELVNSRRRRSWAVLHSGGASSGTKHLGVLGS